MARGKPHRRTAPLRARGTSGVEPGPSLYRPISKTKVPSEAGRQRLNRQLYRSSKHHSPASNPLGGSETAGCGRRRPAQPASIRDVRDITEAAPLARHGTTTSVAPQTTLARFFLIPGELSGSADHFCRAEAGSFSRAPQGGLRIPNGDSKTPDETLNFAWEYPFAQDPQSDRLPDPLSLVHPRSGYELREYWSSVGFRARGPFDGRPR